MTDKKKLKKYAEAEKLTKEAEALSQAGTEKKDASVEVEIEAVAGKSREKELEAVIEELQQEKQSHYDRLLRVSAEFDNYKKRGAREMEEFRKYSNESLLKELLTVVDNLERAVGSSDSGSCDSSGLIQGVKMTLSGILKIFEKFGVKPIDAVKRPFDPNFHQAMMKEENGDYPENTVLKEFQRGYLIYDRLLRPAMVVVSAGKTRSEEDEKRQNEQ